MWLSWLINWLSWLINWLRTGSLSQSESEGENEVETSSLCSVGENEVETSSLSQSESEGENEVETSSLCSVVENEVETRGSSSLIEAVLRYFTYTCFKLQSSRGTEYDFDDFMGDKGGGDAFEDYCNFPFLVSELESQLLSPNDVPGLEKRSRSMASYLNGISAFEENEVNDTGNNVMIPFPAVAQDHQYENNAIAMRSITTLNDDVGQSNSVIPPPLILGVSQVNYSYATNTDGGDEQNNGEICLSTQDRQYENNAIAMRSRTTLNDDVGQSNSVIPPPINQGVPQVNYSYATNTDGGDEQNNGEICLSLEVIKQHFHMNMDDAAKGLKVSRSTLKRKCRIHGIKRWPCRKRRNINDTGRSNENNLNKLINTVGCASSSNSSVTIKAKCGDDIIKFSLPVKSGLDDLRQKLSKRLDLKIPSFRIKYKDEEDDLVLITCDEDLQEFLGSSRLSRSIDHRTIFDILVFPVAE